MSPKVVSPTLLYRTALILLFVCKYSYAEDDAMASSLDLLDPAMLSIEDLMQQQVSTASKSEQSFSDTSAAVFVISQEDIRRAGVTQIADALRLVPGFHVARIDASKWAVSGRGFNGRYANKLLVMIDGRTLYTPTFSGVYWETLDLVLDDIERIEVVRGPGASVWGANAFNGVVNVITKSAEDTTTNLLSVVSGNEDKLIASGRAGGALGDLGHLRLYVKHVDRDGMADVTGGDAGDDWYLNRMGFRADLPYAGQGGLMFQGDIYTGSLRQNFNVPSLNDPSGFRHVLESGDTSGGHLLARWQYSPSASSKYTTQAYLDRFRRMDTFQHEERDTLDLDFQHEFAPGRNQEIVWGVGYRLSRDEILPADLVSVWNPQEDLRLFSLFAQDRFGLMDQRLELTLGAKLEHHTYSDWQFQPSMRALWKLDERQRIWAAVSRAARTPSRGERSAKLNVRGIPPRQSILVVEGDDAFGPEEVVSYEVGYRMWPSPAFSLDLSLYYNNYDDIRFAQVTAPVQSGEIPLRIVNGEQAKTQGVELAVDWRARDWLRLQLAYTYMRADYRLKPGFGDPAEVFPPGDERDPRHLFSLRSAFTLPNRLEFDLGLRYVDGIPDITLINTAEYPDVDSYWSLDARLAWRPLPDLEFSLVGRDLLDPRHLEYLQELGAYPVLVERSVHGQVKWEF